MVSFRLYQELSQLISAVWGEVWPEAGDLVVLCSIESFLGHAVSTVAAQPAATEELNHLPILEILYCHLVYIPFYIGK